MRLSALSLFVSAASAAVLSDRQLITGSTVCQQIAGSITGKVYTALDPLLNTNFITAQQHWFSSSSQTAACVVEVANTKDVATVMKIVGSTRTPFAVKSGGHASNPGFSSTPGVFISLVKIKQVNLNADKSVAEIGLGNAWTDVYKALNGSGVSVVGGRVAGPGVGGFSLGGGYSWLTDQFGLTCDTVKSFTLVLPSGEIKEVDSSVPDLFFALKGGLNRFGIVTVIHYNTVPLPDLIYGGIQLLDSSAIPAVINATEEFQRTNTDPKAQVIFTINAGTIPSILLSFYAGPSRPAAFAPFDKALAAHQPLISTLKTQSYSDFVSGVPSQFEAGNRGAFHTLSTTSLTRNFLQAVYNESTFYGATSLLHSGLVLSFDVEPFTDYGKHATDSAYPHANSPLPLNLFFGWSSSSQDAYWRGVMQQSVNYLTEVAKKEGIYSPDMYAYPNYALDTYSGPQLYGPTNAAKLRAIQQRYDPNGVMRLTGGFSF